MSTLFQHVSKAKIVSSLFQHSGVRFIPTVVRLIPTLFETRNCVHLNTPTRKKVSALFCKCTPYSRLLRFCLNTVHLSTVSPNGPLLNPYWTPTLTLLDPYQTPTGFLMDTMPSLMKRLTRTKHEIYYRGFSYGVNF